MTRRIATAILLLASIAAFARNNDWPKVKQDCKQVSSSAASPGFWKRVVTCGIEFFQARPAHLIIRSMAPGGGVGLGSTFQQDFNHDKWQRGMTATGLGSFHGFWMGEVRYRATHDKFGKDNSARDRFELEFYSVARGLPHIPFYGIGPFASRANVTNFSERDVIVGAHIFNPFSSWFAMGGRIEGIWPDVNGVQGSHLRSIASVFSEASAPGLASQPGFIHYEMYMEPRRPRHKFQFDYKAGYNFYQDQETGHYTFRAFKVDGTHLFHPTGHAEDVFTIHNRLTLSGASGSNVVPFYMQETLGGSDVNGQSALRGFSDYRFRGPDLVLIQAEYDHRVWGPIGFLGFYDTGQVALKASELSLAQMRHSFGFGASFWAAGKAWFKVYVGLGSGEGPHRYFGIPSL